MKKRKSIQFLTAAALSVTLLGSQLPMPIMAESSAVIEVNKLFPDNITVSELMPLADIKLPKSEFGKLKWLDDSIELAAVRKQ